MLQNCCERVSLFPCTPHPTRCQYPLINYLGSDNHNSAANLSGKGTEKLPKLPTGGLFANGFPKLKSPSLKAKSGKDFFLKKYQGKYFILYFLFNIQLI